MYWHKRSRVCARRGSYLVVAFGGGYFGGFHEGKFYGAGAGGAVGGGELIGQGTQAGGTGGLHLRGHLVGASGRGRSLSLGVGKHVDLREADVTDERAGVLEVLIGLAGKAHDDVGGQRDGRNAGT